MSILKAALSRETVERNHVKAVNEDRKAERDAVVAAIHKVFVPEIPELEKLSLTGDYGRSVTMVEAQAGRLTQNTLEERLMKFGAVYCTELGLEVHLANRVSPECLNLDVQERTDHKALEVALVHHRSRRHPDNMQTLATFHGHTDPAEMVERFFEALAKYVVEAEAQPQVA